MCCINYKFSTISLNILIVGVIILFLSLSGLHDNSDNKIVGKLNIKDTCSILLVLGICMIIFSLLTLCKKTNNGYNSI